MTEHEAEALYGLLFVVLTCEEDEGVQQAVIDLIARDPEAREAVLALHDRRN